MSVGLMSVGGLMSEDLKLSKEKVTLPLIKGQRPLYMQTDFSLPIFLYQYRPIKRRDIPARYAAQPPEAKATPRHICVGDEDAPIMSPAGMAANPALIVAIAPIRPARLR